MLLTTQRNRLIWSHISCQCSFHTEVKTPNNLNHPRHISTLRPQKTQRQSKASNSKMEAINNKLQTLSTLNHDTLMPNYNCCQVLNLSDCMAIFIWDHFHSLSSCLFTHTAMIRAFRMIVCLGLGPFCPVIFTPLYRVGTMAAWIIQMDAVLHLLRFDNT